MQESRRQADRDPGGPEEVGTGPNAVAKSAEVTTQRVAVRSDQRTPDGRLEVRRSCSDVPGTEAPNGLKSCVTDKLSLSDL